MIKQVEKSQLKECVKLIRLSFATVADDFNLTHENCPTHPSLMQLRHLEALYQKGIVMFCYIENKKISGFVAIEQPEKDKPWWYIEKLAVPPAHRHKGIGRKLIQFAISEIEKKGGTYISIALIAEQNILKSWYAKQGFSEFMTKQFNHLPFGVCFMEYPLFQTEQVSGNSQELKHLIKALDDDLRERYGDAPIHGVNLKKADESGIVFMIGYYGKKTICCGALRPFSKTQVELKRMFVEKSFREKGFSKKLFQKLEAKAIEIGFKKIILETGKKQHEAQGLYQKMGFSPIEKFGEYTKDENSLCFNKQIGS